MATWTRACVGLSRCGRWNLAWSGVCVPLLLVGLCLALHSAIDSGQTDDRCAAIPPVTPWSHRVTVERTTTSSDTDQYALVRVRAAYSEDATSLRDHPHADDHAPVVPILFVHGHRGSSNQAVHLAAYLHHQSRTTARGDGPTSHLKPATPGLAGSTSNSTQRPRYDVFAVEFGDGPGSDPAFSAAIVRYQADFVNDALRTLKGMYPPATSGHTPGMQAVGLSFGGVVLQLAVTHARHPTGRRADGTPTPSCLTQVIVLNSPLAAPPAFFEAEMVDLYDEIHDWYDRKRREDTPRLLSLSGGSRDTLVRGDLGRPGRPEQEQTGAHVYTSGMEGVDIEIDHDAIVRCAQILHQLARAFDAGAQFGSAAMQPTSKAMPYTATSGLSGSSDLSFSRVVDLTSAPRLSSHELHVAPPSAAFWTPPQSDAIDADARTITILTNVPSQFITVEMSGDRAIGYGACHDLSLPLNTAHLSAADQRRVGLSQWSPDEHVWHSSPLVDAARPVTGYVLSHAHTLHSDAATRTDAAERQMEPPTCHRRIRSNTSTPGGDLKLIFRLPEESRDARLWLLVHFSSASPVPLSSAHEESALVRADHRTVKSPGAWQLEWERTSANHNGSATDADAATRQMPLFPPFAHSLLRESGESRWAFTERTTAEARFGHLPLGRFHDPPGESSLYSLVAFTDPRFAYTMRIVPDRVASMGQWLRRWYDEIVSATFAWTVAALAMQIRASETAMRAQADGQLAAAAPRGICVTLASHSVGAFLLGGVYTQARAWCEPLFGVARVSKDPALVYLHWLLLMVGWSIVVVGAGVCEALHAVLVRLLTALLRGRHAEPSRAGTHRTVHRETQADAGTWAHRLLLLVSAAVLLAYPLPTLAGCLLLSVCVRIRTEARAAHSWSKSAPAARAGVLAASFHLLVVGSLLPRVPTVWHQLRSREFPLPRGSLSWLTDVAAAGLTIATMHRLATAQRTALTPTNALLPIAEEAEEADPRLLGFSSAFQWSSLRLPRRRCRLALVVCGAVALFAPYFAEAHPHRVLFAVAWMGAPLLLDWQDLVGLGDERPTKRQLQLANSEQSRRRPSEPTVREEGSTPPGDLDLEAVSLLHTPPAVT